MRVNFRAPLMLTHLLLPALKASPGSHLVNVSSLFGLVAPAGQSAYAASKFALRGLTEVLRHELPQSGVGVTAVHPGGIRTRIASSARAGSGVPMAEAMAGQRDFERLLTMDAAEAARIIVHGVENRRNRVLVGWSAKVPTSSQDCCRPRTDPCWRACPPRRWRCGDDERPSSLLHARACRRG